MRMSRVFGRTLTRILLGCALCMVLPLAFAADEDRYISYTVSGKLVEAKSGAPLAGATIEFVSTAARGGSKTALTDDQGEFVVRGLGDGLHAVAVRTADGQEIRGLYAKKVPGSDTVEIFFRPKKGGRAETSIDIGQFEGNVKGATQWGRFWRQFWIYFGAVVVAAVLLL